MQVSSQILRPLAGCDGCVQLLISKDIERLILRPLAGCDYSAEGNILLEDEETLISVPLRGVMAKMNKSDRPETGRMHLFHNAGTIITHSAQKEKRNGEKNAAFSGANRAGGARKKHEF